MVIESNSLQYKSKVFVRVAQVLIGTNEALPKKVRPHDVRRVMEASNILYAASAWLRFGVGELPAEFVPQIGGEAYKTLSGMKRLGSIELAAQGRFWDTVSNAVATLNGVVVGQRPEAGAVARAAQLCTEVGMHLAQV